MRPTPAVEMYMPSAAPRSTTLVSPVTMDTPAAAAASAMSATISRRASMENPSSSTNAADRASGRAPIMARSLTVPCTARWPDRPAGEAQGLDDVGVGAEGQPLARRQGQHGGVGLRGGRVGGEGRAGTPRRAGPPRPCRPAPWASVTTSSSKRGRRRRNASMRSKTTASRPRPAGARCPVRCRSCRPPSSSQTAAGRSTTARA